MARTAAAYSRQPIGQVEHQTLWACLKFVALPGEGISVACERNRMNVRPLIVRELRAEARRANTYWLRAVAAGLLTALFVWSAWTFQASGTLLGPMLFYSLSQGLEIAMLAIIAALAADSISREKREGTLGLLFLTPLT